MNRKTNHYTNTVMKTVLCLQLAALLFTTAFAGSAVAATGVPFAGVVEGTEDFNPVFDPNAPVGSDPIGLNIIGSGGGQATHLGRFTATWDFDITFGVDFSPGTRHFVADNGDELWTEATGSGTPPDADPNFNQTVVEAHVITGGTGRFAGATGSFTVERMVYDVRPGVDLVTSGSFSGYLILAPQGEPFQGLVSGLEDFNPVFDANDPTATDPIGLNIVGSGGGIATTLGRFTATWDFDVTFGVDPSPGTRHFVAANGDELWSEATGSGTPPDADPNFNQTIVEAHVITGGTGRFAGATGHFTVERMVYDVRPGVDLVTSGSLSGYIVLAPEGEPFEGLIEGTEDFNPVFDPTAPVGSDPIGLNIVGSGSGEATHLGQFTATWEFDITFGVGPSPGTRHFVAANGDELWTEATGSGTPPDADPNFNQTVVEAHVITGGTGRFAGATGSFTVERMVYDVRPGVNLVTSGSFSGYIILVPEGDLILPVE